VVFHFLKCLVLFHFLKNWGRLPFSEKLRLSSISWSIEVVFHFLKFRSSSSDSKLSSIANKLHDFQQLITGHLINGRENANQSSLTLAKVEFSFKLIKYHQILFSLQRILLLPKLRCHKCNINCFFSFIVKHTCVELSFYSLECWKHPSNLEYK
jgi:hypothetical protein